MSLLPNQTRIQDYSCPDCSARLFRICQIGVLTFHFFFFRNLISAANFHAEFPECNKIKYQLPKWGDPSGGRSLWTLQSQMEIFPSSKTRCSMTPRYVWYLIWLLIAFIILLFRSLILLREARGLMSASLSGSACSPEAGISRLFCLVRRPSSVRVRRLLSAQQQPRTR